MEKHKNADKNDVQRDSVGQPNPAWQMERDNIEKARKRQEDAEKEAKSKETRQAL